MAFFLHDGLAFHYREVGDGVPFVFQHGLGGDISQTFDMFAAPTAFRTAAFDFRGHGATRPLGPPEKLGFSSYADDLNTFLDVLGSPRAVVGGISMGAGVALNFALRFPDRVLGLVLCRPAWLDAPSPPNLAVFVRIARLIREHGAEGGRDRFLTAPEYLELLNEGPYPAESALEQFDHPRARETVDKLERMPRDAPNLDRREWATIGVPTLILANRLDPVHPFRYGEELAAEIPGAELREVVSKSVDKALHQRQARIAIEVFLERLLQPQNKRVEGPERISRKGPRRKSL